MSLREVEWEACLLEPRPTPEWERRFREQTGRSGDVMQYVVGCDWLCEAVVSFSVQVSTHLAVEPDLADLVGLVVSQDNSCRFCFGLQRAFLRVLGMSERHISQLEQNLLTDELQPRERAALAYARRLSSSRPLATRADLDALSEVGYDDREIAELTSLVALHLFFNRIATFPALPPERMESFPELWWVRLFRPLLERRFRRKIRMRGRPTALDPRQREGPFSGIVNAMDGLPCAPVFRRILDRAFESEALSARAAPMAFAVVSRALGCPACEQEAVRVLAERGLAPKQIDEILQHLSSEELSETEELVASFARESIWYQPASIQRRCRELRGLLDREQFLELLGLCALANSICRLGLMIGADG